MNDIDNALSVCKEMRDARMTSDTSRYSGRAQEAAALDTLIQRLEAYQRLEAATHRLFVESDEFSKRPDGIRWTVRGRAYDNLLKAFAATQEEGNEAHRRNDDYGMVRLD